MDGGGRRERGRYVGATDEFGWSITDSPVPINDWHVTLLDLMGLDDLQLTYRLQRRDFRLTDIGGRVVEQLLA